MTRSRIIAGKAVILIEAQDRINKTLAGTRAKLHKFANEAGNIGDSLFRTGFFGAIASGAILSGFVKFDDAMRTLRVNLDLFGKTAEQVDRVMKPLEERIRTLAKTTPFSPTQVAEAGISLAKGGFDDKQISNALQGVLDLARATGTELGFTSQFVVRVMKTFQLSAERTSETVSQLVRATRKGTLGIEDLEAAMRYASGTGNTLGVSLERMLALFTFLSDRGLVGSIGGTSLNTAFAQLTKKAVDIQKEFNVPLVVGVDVNGEQAIDVLTTIQNLFRETAKLPINEQVATYQKIFNLRGSRPVTAIGNVKSINEILKLTEFIADAGNEARKASEIIDSGVGGALRRLLSTVQNLSTTLSQETQQAIIAVANAVTKLVDAITLLSIKFPKATTAFLFSPIFLLGAGTGFLALSKSLRIAAGAVSLFTAAYRPLATLLVKGTTGQLAALSKFLPKKSPTGKTSSTKGVLGFLKSLLTGANVARRFVFSFSGVLTILEGLFLFGDKIPGISTVLERLGKAFSNAFKAIGNIATFIAGPIAVLRASFAAFTAGNKELGAEGLVKGLKLAAGIIKNQLYLAWLRFKQSLGTVYGILKQIAVGIYSTFESIIVSIGSVIETTVDAVQTRIAPITSLFKDSGYGFENGVQTIAKLVREFSLILANIPIAIATAFEKVSSVLDQFTISFEQMIRRVLPASIIGKEGTVIDPREAAKLSTREFKELDNQLNRLKQNPRAAELQSIGRFSSAFKFGLEEGIIAKKFEGLANKYIPESEGRSLQRQLESNVRLEKLDKQRQANIKNIDNAFNSIDLPNLGKEIKKTVNDSVRLLKDGFLSASQITNKLALDEQLARNKTAIAEEIERRRLAGSTQGITPTTAATLDQVKKAGISIAAALVGSASFTRGNQLRFPNIEKEQRDLLKSIDENIKKGLENEGVFTFTQ